MTRQDFRTLILTVSTSNCQLPETPLPRSQAFSAACVVEALGTRIFIKHLSSLGCKQLFILYFIVVQFDPCLLVI